MLNHLTQSIFSQSTSSIGPGLLLLSLAVSLLLGWVISCVYRYKTAYSREFVLTLTLLPSLIAVIIFLVNGNLGTSVAVAGTFSLIKFRSPASSAKELLLVFMATAIGLATGMGYLGLALVVTLGLSLVMVLLEQVTLAPRRQHRQLSLKLPSQTANIASLKHQLEQWCSSVDLLSLKHQKNVLEVIYQVELVSSEAQLLTQLLSYDDSLELALTKVTTKKKAL